MAPPLGTLLLRNLHADPPEVTCSIKACKDDLDEALQRLLASGKLEAFGTWSFPVPAGSSAPGPNPLAVLHVLAGDAGPDIRLLEWQGDDASHRDQSLVTQARVDFAKWHKVDLEQGRCTVFRFPDRDKELVLVPVRVKTGGGKSAPGCAYWGFTVTANLLPTVATVLHKSKLVLVFDIDETLLMAHTLDSLQTRLQRIKAERKAKAAELDAATKGETEPDNLQQLGAELAAMEREQELLQKDFDMLEFFKTDAACRVRVQGPPGMQPQLYEPSWETARLAQGSTVTRPVVRLELGGRPVYITRIQPTTRNTSMLIRPRPGWEQLRNYIAGLMDLEQFGVKKERWEVYLCTTAEREYAWEAWRLLDPSASIFPHEQLAWRMMCVSHPQKKDLLNVLRKKEVDALAALGTAPQIASDPQLVTDKTRASRPRLGSPAPLCVVVDDRLDVWEEDSRKAVLQVMPFHPHKEAANLDLGSEDAPKQAYQQALDSEAELKRVHATIQHVRSGIYMTFDQAVAPEVRRLTTSGVLEALQSTADSIKLHSLQPLKSVPQLLSEAPAKPPAALGSTEKDDRASDLRLLAHDGSMAAAANGNGAPADPRKRRLAAASAGDQAAAGQMGPPADRQQGQRQDEVEQEQQQDQQQPPAKKQKKEKKKKALFGDIMSSLQRQPSELQQQPLQEEQPMVQDSGGGGQQQPDAAAAAAGAAAAGERGHAADFAAAAGPGTAPQGAAGRGKGIRGLAAAAAAAGSGPSSTTGSSGQQQEPQLLLGPLSQAFAAPALPADAMQLLMSRLGSAAPNSPEAAAALLEMLPQPLRDLVPPEDVWVVLSVVQLMTHSGTGGSQLDAALQQLLPARVLAAARDVQRMVWEDDTLANLMGPILSKVAAAVQVGPLPTGGGGSSNEQGRMQGQGPSQQQQQQQVPLQHRQLLGVGAADAATPPASPLGAGGGVQVVDFRSLGVTGQQQQHQQQQQQGLGAGSSSSTAGGQSLRWQPLLQAGQGSSNQGGQLSLGSMGMVGSRLGGGMPPSGQQPPGLGQPPQQQQQGQLLGPQQFFQQQQQQQQGQPPPPGMFTSGPPSGSASQLGGRGSQGGFMQGGQQPQGALQQQGPPGGGPVMMMQGGPVYFVQGPGGAPMQLPPGLGLQGPPPPMQQAAQFGMPAALAGGQQQQQQQLMMMAGHMQQQQQQQPGLGPGFQQPGGQQQPGRQRQQHGRGAGGRSNQRGGKPWQLQREQQQQQGRGQGQGQGQGQQQVLPARGRGAPGAKAGHRGGARQGQGGRRHQQQQHTKGRGRG